MAQRLCRPYLPLLVSVVLIGGIGGSSSAGYVGHPTDSTGGEVREGTQLVSAGIGDGDEPQGHRQFLVSGAVTGLWPGVDRQLDLSVTNPNRQPIRLLTLGATADGPHGCTASENLRISAYDASAPGAGEYLIQGGSSVVVPLQVTLLDLPENQRFCEGATFRLTYHGSAEGTGGKP